MEAIREQYGLTALRLGYTQGGRGADGRREVTCSVRGPAGPDGSGWWVPADGIPLLAGSGPTSSDEGVEAGLAECVARLQSSVAVQALQPGHDAFWLAVTAEHPLLPGVAWERGLDTVGLPVLRLPAQLNVEPTAASPRPRVVVCVSMPVAKEPFPAEMLVGQIVDAVDAQAVGADVHVFADGERASLLRTVLGGRAQVHDPREEGVHAPASRSAAPGDDRQPWLAWIEDRMEGRIDVLHLVGHGFLATGQGAFAVTEAPDRNYDTSTARFVWPQQVAALMAATGAWGLVATAVPVNYSVPGLRLFTSQVAAQRAAAAAFVDSDQPAPAPLDAVYRLLLRYPAAPPPSTRGLMLIMHPGRFGLLSPTPAAYLPAQTDLASWVASGEALPAWMVGAQRQIGQWESELSFGSDTTQIESTRQAFEAAKQRLDEIVRSARQTGGTT
jgi:hypothetical protein